MPLFHAWTSYSTFPYTEETPTYENVYRRKKVYSGSSNLINAKFLSREFICKSCYTQVSLQCKKPTDAVFLSFLYYPLFSVSNHNNVHLNINSHDISRDIWTFSRYFKTLFVPLFIAEPLAMFCETVVGKQLSRLSKVERELETIWDKVEVAQFEVCMERLW